MSSSTVRAAVAQWITGGNVAGVNKVYKAQPWYVDGQQWNLAAQAGNGSVLFVHIADEIEARIDVPVIQGHKAITYQIGLVVLYQFLLPSAATASVSEDSWVGPLDTQLDALKARLRADPTLGTNGSPIFEAAQDPNDCHIVRDLPRRTTGSIQSWNVIEFHATEIINA